MVKKQTLTSVLQMVRQTSVDAKFQEAFEQRLLARRMIKDLAIRRTAHGLTQRDLAQKIGCTQGRISKFESSEDGDLRLGDLARYVDAIGLRLKVTLESTDPASAGAVKNLAFDYCPDDARGTQQQPHLPHPATPTVQPGRSTGRKTRKRRRA
jgi:transcriptional regulator with XRE-family HTH domain